MSETSSGKSRVGVGVGVGGHSAIWRYLIPVVHTVAAEVRSW